MSDNDLIRRKDALAAMKRAKAAYLKSTDNTPLDFFWCDAIAALPAVTVGVTPLTSETGHFARAAVDLVKTLQGYGLAVGVGQSDSDELDFCVTVYHGKELLGCASLHEDRTWSCYMTVGETVFKCESTPWHSLPEGMDAAIAALTPTPVDASQLADPAIKALDDLARLGQEFDAAPDPTLRPTMTDLMVDPDTLDAFMEANPLPDTPDPTAIREGDYFKGIEEGIKIGREAALREAAAVISRGGLHTISDRADAILALIQKGAAE